MSKSQFHSVKAGIGCEASTTQQKGNAMSEIGHNSEKVAEEIKKLAEEYAECDKDSMTLNKRRQKIRERVEEIGHDKDAFVEEVNLSKKSLKRKEGYTESKKFISSVINGMDQFELWSHVVEDQKAKEEERTKAKEAKAAAKKEAKAKAKTGKKDPTPEPKATAKPDAKAGSEGPSIGQQQAAAYQKAHGTPQNQAVN